MFEYGSGVVEITCAAVKLAPTATGTFGSLRND